jgi:Arc/MetJ family transcription regulator
MVPGNARLLFRGSEGRYLFSAIFSEEVYAISRDGISPRYVFDFGPHAITLEEQMASFKNDNNYPSKMLMQEGPFIETRDYFYFLILKHKTPERVADAVMVRNHRTGEMVQIEPDDILYSNAQLALGLTLEDEFVASLDPADLVTRADTILTNRFRYPKEILQKIPLLKPDDNPVLVFFTIK